MAGLTLKQDDFAIAYVESGNASEAYRRVYKPKATTKEATINRTAKGLVDNPKIAARVTELRAPVIADLGITLESHLRELETLREMSKEQGQLTAAITAEVARGKASGVHVEKSKLDVSIEARVRAEVEHSFLVEVLGAVAGKSRDFARGGK